jgi:hypothetical protein
MQDSDAIRGLPLIKRSAWLGAKISFIVLAPICILGWLVAVVAIVYKSYLSGVSPFELISAVDASSPDILSRIVNGLLALVVLMAIGVAFSRFAGAAIGAVTAGIRVLRCLIRR